MPRRRALIFGSVLIAILTLTLALPLAGCGGSGNSISEEKYNQIQKGMTLDEVEGIAGSPERTHKTGSTKDPNIIWYYSKTDGDGLVRVSFLSGKVDSLSPYNQDIQPEE